LHLFGFCGSKDDINKMHHLSSIGVEEVKACAACARVTICLRQAWAFKDQPLIKNIL